MVFLPPDQNTQAPIANNHGSVEVPNYPNEVKYQAAATTYDQVQYPSPAGDGRVGVPQYPEQEYSYHCMAQSMILVQVNPGEAFTIQAEDGRTQCIQGPAQVPMVSPNGAIPPIHVPHGYISQVIEENGLRRVVVIPEMPHTHYTGTPGGQPIMSPQPGMQHLSMQPGPPLNYMPQMNMMSLNQQTPVYPSAEQLPVFHHQPMTYMQTEGSLNSDSQPLPNLPQFHQYHLHSSEMDPASPSARASKAKERLQKKLQERQNQHQNETNKNPSPISVSPSPSSSYAATPSPNSSPDSSPRILGVPLPAYSNGYNNTRNLIHPMQQHLLGSPQHFHHHQPHPSPTHSPNFTRAGSNGCNNRNSKNQPMSPRANSEDMSSGSSSSGSPRRVPAGMQRVPAMPQEMGHQYEANIHQQDTTFHSNLPQEAFPMIDGKKHLKEFLSAIVKPEIYDVAPRSAHLKWAMCFSLPKDAESFVKDRKIIFEIFLSDKGKDHHRFRSIHRDSNTYFLIRDLKPGVEYHTRVLAELNAVKGSHSEITSFRTLSCPPDTPGAPKLIHRTKNSLTLKWAAPHDNGERILKYHVEWDEGKKGSGFRALYSDTQKQYKVVKLQQSHAYTFRLNSINKMGSSPWSPEVEYMTAGSAPSVPDAPRLAKSTVRTITLTWSRVPGGSGDAGSGYIGYILEKDDDKGYGFRVVYDGTDLRATIKNLNRSTSYKFRLCAYNNDGTSGYSDIVSYLTNPDKPGPPGKVLLKGKTHSTWFKVTWDPPKDTGGGEIAEYVLECCHERGTAMNSIYSGPDREFLLENVQPGLPCRLRVHCASDGGVSMPSDVTVITPPPVVPGQCAPPRSSSKARPNIISLKWDPPSYAGGTSVTSYEVVMEYFNQSTEDIEGQTEVIGQQVYQGPNLDYSVGGLRPGTGYKFMIRAANKVGNGPWSDMIELDTSPGPPEKPGVPVAQSIFSGSILLTWQEPHDNGSEITGYTVEVRSVDNTMSLQQLGPCLSHNIQHLSPDTTYFLRLQAHNAVGKSSFSDVATVTTLPSCPNRVTNVWQGDTTSSMNFDPEEEDDDLDLEEVERSSSTPATSVMLQWEAPNSNGSDITSYILELTPLVKSTARKKLQTAEEDSVLVQVSGRSTSHLVQDLQPDTEHRIRIKAVNDIGPGPFSLPTTIETQPLPPSPPVLECSCLYNGLKLKWSDSDQFNNTYLLQMKEKHGRFVTIYNGLGRSSRVNRLSERSTYHFRINARNDAGEGPFSTTYTFTTSTAPPPQLKHLPSVIVKQGVAEITWEDVEAIKGDPVSYIINIEDLEDSSNRQSYTSERPIFEFGPLEPMSKYKVQVALVRLIYPPTTASASKPTKQTESTSTDGLAEEVSSVNTVLSQDPDSPVAMENENFQEEQEENPEPEEIVGQFSNWMMFEVPIPKPESETESKMVGIPDTLSGHLQTASSLLKSAPVKMSDEKKAAFLLAAFFVFAVLLAFLVQCLVT